MSNFPYIFFAGKGGGGSEIGSCRLLLLQYIPISFRGGGEQRLTSKTLGSEVEKETRAGYVRVIMLWVFFLKKGEMVNQCTETLLYYFFMLETEGRREFHCILYFKSYTILSHRTFLSGSLQNRVRKLKIFPTKP